LQSLKAAAKVVRVVVLGVRRALTRQEGLAQLAPGNEPDAILRPSRLYTQMVLALY
jgi:hypothetical protein